MIKQRDISELKPWLQEQMKSLKADIGTCANPESKQWLEGRLSAFEMVFLYFTDWKTDRILGIEKEMEGLLIMTDKEKGMADRLLSGELDL